MKAFHTSRNIQELYSSHFDVFSRRSARMDEIDELRRGVNENPSLFITALDKAELSPQEAFTELHYAWGRCDLNSASEALFNKRMREMKQRYPGLRRLGDTSPRSVRPSFEQGYNWAKPSQ